MSEPNGTEETKILRELDRLKRGFKHLTDLVLMNQSAIQALAEEVLTENQLASYDARAEQLYRDLRQTGQE
jgi:cell division FtsZ-interacting protein ZapD